MKFNNILFSALTAVTLSACSGGNGGAFNGDAGNAAEPVLTAADLRDSGNVPADFNYESSPEVAYEFKVSEVGGGIVEGTYVRIFSVNVIDTQEDENGQLADFYGPGFQMAATRTNSLGVAAGQLNLPVGVDQVYVQVDTPGFASGVYPVSNGQIVADFVRG